MFSYRLWSYDVTQTCTAECASELDVPGVAEVPPVQSDVSAGLDLSGDHLSYSQDWAFGA